MTSPTEPRTARPIMVAEVEEMVAELTADNFHQAASLITRLAGEKAADRAVLNGEINRITIKLRKAEAERDALRAEREQLHLTICGGEDAPGYADSIPTSKVIEVFHENRRSAEAKLSAANARAEGLQKRVDLLEKAAITKDNPNE